MPSVKEIVVGQGVKYIMIGGTLVAIVGGVYYVVKKKIKKLNPFSGSSKGDVLDTIETIAKLNPAYMVADLARQAAVKLAEKKAAAKREQDRIDVRDKIAEIEARNAPYERTGFKQKNGLM